MNTELRAERVRQSKSVSYMAGVIGKTNDTYSKKERGVVKFTTDEIVAITKDLGLSSARFNEIFFESRLPFSKLPRMM